MTLVLVTPPAVEPVDAIECCYRLRIEADAAEEADVAAMIQSARQEIDGAMGWLGRALLTQTWDLQLDAFACSAIEVPLPPLQSVTSVKYLDQDGAEQTLSPSVYRVVSGGDRPSSIELAYGQTWPATRSVSAAVTVRFVAGWTAPSLVPAPIRTWIMARVGGLYAQREDLVLTGQQVTIAPNLEHMLAPYRVGWFGAP